MEFFMNISTKAVLATAVLATMLGSGEIWGATTSAPLIVKAITGIACTLSISNGAIIDFGTITTYIPSSFYDRSVDVTLDCGAVITDVTVDFDHGIYADSNIPPNRFITNGSSRKIGYGLWSDSTHFTKLGSTSPENALNYHIAGSPLAHTVYSTITSFPTPPYGPGQELSDMVTVTATY
jgi:spore coat protein U-like protein